MIVNSFAIMSTYTMEEINEVEDLNFDRYESQLTKLSKGGQLKQFAIATFEKEMENLKDTVSSVYSTCFLIIVPFKFSKLKL